MKKISDTDLNLLEKESESALKRRAFRVLHPPEFKGCRIMINTFQKDSYACPHLHEDKEEIFIHLKGKFYIVLFDNSGKIEDVFLFDEKNAKIVEIPKLKYHTIIPLEKGSSVCEVSVGPHNPDSYKKFADWASEEGTQRAEEYMKKLFEEAESFLKTK